MKRREFIRKTAMASFFISTGTQTNLLLANNPVHEKLIMPELQGKQIFIDNYDEEVWLGWLARLVVSSLVTTLTAKIVEKYTDGCVCDGTTCRKSPANYSNAKGIYGYDNGRTRFVRQTVDDRRVSFDNVSVPFLTSSNRQIGNVEGPFLAGMCWAAEELDKTYRKETVRRVLMPTSMKQNGGYRFDTDSCYPTKYKTEYGGTEIRYTPRSGKNGTVTVKARDKYDNLDWSESYDFNYA